ncbi:MAG TPA: hypothetical protein VGX68_23745 [Thermoanaerobaculia bacterium]|nr:hypothetical protein [Thermoanaerobaculia bacterium]
MKPILSSLAILTLLLLTAPALAVINTSAPSVAAAGDCDVDLAQLLAASEASLCSSKPGDLIGSVPAPLDLAAPHCCGTGAADACRDFCRQQGPSCKGSIGCRAGECVCTCSC